MGTANFGTSKFLNGIYASLMPTEVNTKVCNDCGHKHTENEFDLEKLKYCNYCGSANLENEEITIYPNEFEYEDFIENVQETLKKNFKYFYEDDIWVSSDTKRIGLIETDNYYYGDVGFSFIFDILLENGYYEGVRLDVDMRVLDGDGYEITDYTDDYADYIMSESKMNAGMKAIQKANLEGKMEEVKEEYLSKIEKIFKELSQHTLKVCARFSNGETIYCAI